MAFLISFIQYAIKFVIMVAVAGCGIFIGKKMRDRKNAQVSKKWVSPLGSYCFSILRGTGHFVRCVQPSKRHHIFCMCAHHIFGKYTMEEINCEKVWSK